MAKTSRSYNWQYSLVVLTGTVVSLVVVAALYWAQVVFVPLALAVFLTFLLSPLVLTLQRRGLGRIPSIVLVVTFAAAVLAGTGWVVTRQVTHLISELPEHSEKIVARARSLRELVQGANTGRLERLFERIGVELGTKAPEQREHETAADPTSASTPKVTVSSEPKQWPWLSRLPEVLGLLLEPLGAVALAVVLTVFMLWKREDLRNRFIRLVGHGRMTVTTKVVDEAGQRISRYLLMQLIVNGTYGLAWGMGLLLIGVDYALLWGFLAAILRYIPYIGAPIGAVLPLALTLIQFEGWTVPLLVGVLLLVLELVSNNLMEPWLYGQSIGVSEVALLVAAAFWTFLWGPIGLVLSGPLTVCLVVLGKYVPQLGFFDVLLGDEPPLAPEVAYYQRLMAGDQDEAADLVRAYVKAESAQRVYDALLIPALTYGKRDRDRDELTLHDEQAILRATQEIIEDLEDTQVVAAAAGGTKPETTAEAAPAQVRLLACPARDEADRLALEMLRQLLDPTRYTVKITAVETLTAELVAQVEEEKPAVVCIGSLPPGGLAHTRYLCKRLRARAPEVKIMVGRWGLKGNREQNEEQLREAGADGIAFTVAETVSQLMAWQPVFAQDPPPKTATAA